MKHIVLTLVASSFCIWGQAQKLSSTEVPKAVADAFSKKFPAAKNVKWEKEDPSEFEAEFKQGKNELSACFDQTGKWMITETEIRKSELPQAVLTTISKDFGAYEIEEAEKAETADRGIIYEVELEKGNESLDVEFSPDGKILEKGEDKDDKDDDDDN